MADFRKCLLAFALVALLASLASAQNPALQCTFNASVTPTVRSEGLTELMGDIVLNCTGGTPTALGNPVPQANITVNLTVPVTSRVVKSVGGGAYFTEVLLLVDEPHSTSNVTYPNTGTVPNAGVAASDPGKVQLSQCDAVNANVGICSMLGTGNGLGTYDPRNNGMGAATIYNNQAVRPNVFQARVGASNYQVTFFGVPIDPPGTAGSRIIRITNLRGNATILGVSTGVVPSTITAYLSVNPPNLLPLNNPQQTVAYVGKGLSTSVVDGSMTAPVKFVQCVDANLDLAKSRTKKLGTTVPQDGTQFKVRYDEGFASAWKEKNIYEHLQNAGSMVISADRKTLTGITAANYATTANETNQDVPGSNYFSESGFEVGAATYPGVTPAGFGPYETASWVNTVWTDQGRGQQKIGTANQGTRLMAQFASVPTGVILYTPTILPLTVPANSSFVSGFAVLVSTDASGAGDYSAISGTTADTVAGTGVFSQAVVPSSGIVVYEILYDDPFNIERMEIPVTVAFIADAGNNSPQPNVQSTVVGGYAPQSSAGTWDLSNAYPIPRFIPDQPTLNTFIVVKCSCNLLFPWAVYTQGYDTGVAISNTTLDPYGTTPQQGNVTAYYYMNSTQVKKSTTQVVPGGQTVVWTLSGGGTFGMPGIDNGFAGYIIAQSEFQLCHGYAYISSFGALPTSPGTSEGYLGIVLDKDGLPNRTGQVGENRAH